MLSYDPKNRKLISTSGVVVRKRDKKVLKTPIYLSKDETPADYEQGNCHMKATEL